ncbi:MAG: hypothetical protein AABY22_34225 [Nanoarchaeota archaeon]
MSDKCDKFCEHCIDFKCIEEKATVYNFLGKKDRHIVDLFHWIKILQELADEIRSRERNYELENEITEIIKRLTNEVGMRVVSLFP